MTLGPTVTVDAAYATVEIDANGATVTIDVPEPTVDITGVGPQGPAGTGADGYVLQAYDTTDQVAASVTTAYPILLGTTDISDGITVANNGSSQPTRITFANDGNYDIQFSIQFQNTSASEAHANVWFRKNGVDIADSNSQVSVPKKHGSDNGSLILALNLIVNAAGGDYVEIMWQTESLDVSIQALPAGTTPTTPATPSVIVTAAVVRYLEVGPAGPGVPTGGTTGQVLTKSSATDYDTAWATPTAVGLVLVKSQTIGSGVASIDVTSCFSSTYDDYYITVDGTTVSAGGNVGWFLPLVGTTPSSSGWYGNTFYVGNGAAGGLTNAVLSNASYAEIGSITTSTANSFGFDVFAPNLAQDTRVTFISADRTWFRFGAFSLRNSTQYNGFRISSVTGTYTGGTIRVYGRTK